MKDFIYINYNLLVDKLYNNYFFIKDEKIIIRKYTEDSTKLEKLFNLTNNMYYNNILVDTFILNKDNKPYTKRNNEYIVLFKANNRDVELNLDYIYRFSGIDSTLEQYDILIEWKKEIDDLENKMIEYNKEYRLLQDSFNYFVGMSENAISLLSEYDNQKSNDICHKVTNNFNIQEFNNPLTFIRVNKMYDISNYIKSNFYKKKLNYEELYQLIININNEYDEVFLMSCLLYSNNYFDMMKKIISEEIEEKSINIYINNIKEYEKLLSFCQKNMKNSKIVKLINWFN